MTQPYGQEPDPRYGQQETPYGGESSASAYGQQSYGGYASPADRNSALANAYGSPISSGARFGVVGATFAGIGAVLLIISFTAVDWFSNGGPSTFGDIHDALDANSNGATGLAQAYFSWLGWTLLVLVVLIAIAASLPSPASGPLRALGAVLAAAAIAVTFFAIQIFDGTSYSQYLKHASIGFYLALAGFLLAGIGALCGPSNRV